MIFLIVPSLHIKMKRTVRRTPIIERAKFHISILVLKYATKVMNLLSKGKRVSWSAELFWLKSGPHLKKKKKKKKSLRNAAPEGMVNGKKVRHRSKYQIIDNIMICPWAEHYDWCIDIQNMTISMFRLGVGRTTKSIINTRKDLVLWSSVMNSDSHWLGYRCDARCARKR